MFHPALKANVVPRQPAPRNEYEAGNDSHRRKTKTTTLLHEDQHLPAGKRRKLVSTTRDAIRNFIRVGAAVRKHLDFVARHTVDFQTGDEGFDRDLEQWVAERSKADNFDVSGRHDLDRYARLAEARRTIDGDFGTLKLASGHVQAVEADRIRDPLGQHLPANQRSEWYHGVRCNRNGRPVEYALSSRLGVGFAHERIVRADRMIMHLWWDTHFRFDACRGVSPFAPGLNDFIDEHETLTHAQAKVKLAQVFGLKVVTEAVDGLGVTTGTDEDGDGTDEKYEVDLGKGPFKLELDPGEDVDVIEGKTGAEEVIALVQFVADLAVLVLDLPPHFFDSSRTNFHGGKVGTTLYLLSALAKRRDVQRFLSAWLDWQINRAVVAGDIILPRALDLAGLLNSYEWIPGGMPWFDRSREVRPTLQAIAGGIDSYSRVIQEQYGISLEQFLRKYARDQKLIAESGVVLANFDKLIFVPDASGPPTE